MKNIQIIENNSELGAGTRGASLGIEALKMASFNAGSDYFSNRETIKIETENQLLFEKNETPNAIRIKGIKKVYERVSNTVAETLNKNHFPLVLAADHASAGGTIAGIKKQYPDKKLGVIWIDAHGDLHSPYTSPTGNVHGMPLATALAEDNLACQEKELSDEEKKYWDELKNTAGISPKIEAQNLVFYGVRDTEKPEDELIQKLGIKNFTVKECKEKGIKQVSKEGLELLSECDILYISFDVDSMDPKNTSKGTGTPVKGGFKSSRAKKLIQCLMESKKVVCFEMVEINPLLDNKKNAMAEIAFEILEETTKSIEKYSLA